MSALGLFQWYVVSIITQDRAATDRAPTPFDIMNVVQVADPTKLATPVITVNPRGTVAPLRFPSASRMVGLAVVGLTGDVLAQVDVAHRGQRGPAVLGRPSTVMVR
ncbi:hypothetical protein [Streptomyces aquilus]|uniref:hypothetical protein n=1 Tax=Streptomyces aquilus TaxID=2548456 RepID=UPI001417005D|nr:hypothetical protein [Streptomyces aquilus]